MDLTSRSESGSSGCSRLVLLTKLLTSSHAASESIGFKSRQWAAKAECGVALLLR
jgi:hypothetical protein